MIPDHLFLNIHNHFRKRRVYIYIYSNKYSQFSRMGQKTKAAFFYTDPCYDNTIVSYAHPGRCRSYWSCEGGVSVPMCCAPGTAYMPGQGCAVNATCQDSCMDFGNFEKVTAIGKCKCSVKTQTKRHRKRSLCTSSIRYALIRDN